MSSQAYHEHTSCLRIVHVSEGVTVEPNPEVGVLSEEFGTETWEVSEEPTQLYNQGKPRMHLTLPWMF
jgi:hypothetical protein